MRSAGYPSSPFKPAACNPTTLAGGLVSAQVTFTGIGQRQAFAFWDAAGGSSPGNYGTTVINAAVGCTGSIAEGVAVGQQVDQLASCIYSKLSLRGIVALLASESDKYGTTLKGDVVSTTYSLDGNDVLLLVLPANGAGESLLQLLRLSGPDSAVSLKTLVMLEAEGLALYSEQCVLQHRAQPKRPSPLQQEPQVRIPLPLHRIACHCKVLDFDLDLYLAGGKTEESFKCIWRLRCAVPSAEAPPPVVALPPEAPLPAPLAQSPGKTAN